MKAWKHIQQKDRKAGLGLTPTLTLIFYRYVADGKNLLTGDQISSESEQMKKKRQLMEHIVEVNKVIGKRGLSYRRNKAEAFHSRENTGVKYDKVAELIQHRHPCQEVRPESSVFGIFILFFYCYF